MSDLFYHRTRHVYHRTRHVYHRARHAPNGRPAVNHGDQPEALSDHHRRMLEVESGISPEVIARRGYRTASTAADIPDGFESYQYQPRMFPTLVIPQWNSVGRRFAYLLRPDHPRRGQDGRTIK